MRNGPDSKQKGDWQVTAGDDAAVADQEADEEHVFPTPRGVLSAAEIEALLRPNLDTQALADPPETIEPRATPVFDEPTSVVDTHAQERDRVLGARLSRALGAGTGLKAAVIASQSATIVREDLPGLLHGKSSAIACIGPDETDIRALICLPPLLADAIIAKACGARGSTGRIGDGWSLSAIDCALLGQLLVPFGEALGPDLRLQSIETDVPYVSSLLPTREVTIAEFSVEAPGLHSDLAVIQTEGQVADEALAVSEAPAVPITALVTARLARLTVPLSRITELKAGSTLLLGLPGDQPIELLSGDRDGEPAYEGRMGRKGNKMAVKVTKRVRTFQI
ncbi:MAG: FliM/FliN family flagellar motor C-terminal domain-containing protein [Pseudomonadota bacterium]